MAYFSNGSFPDASARRPLRTKSYTAEDFLGSWALGSQTAWDSTKPGAGTASVASLVDNSPGGEVAFSSTSAVCNFVATTGTSLSNGAVTVGCRLKLSSAAGVCVFVGVTDSKTPELSMSLNTNDTIAGVATDVCGLGYDTNGTTAEWFQGGISAGTATAATFSGVAPTTVYTTLDVAVDTAGTLTGSVDGTAVGTTASACATGVDVYPVVVVFSRSGTIKTATMDYIYTERSRD